MPDHPPSPSPVALVAAAGLAVGGVIGIVVLLLLGPVAGVLALAVVAVAVAAACWLAAGAVVLHLVGGAPLDPATAGAARLANLVESVALTVGIPEPALRLVDDPAPNALVTGPDPRRATFVVTSGLLVTLDRLALEAVVAQQLSLIREAHTHRRDVAVAVAGTAGLVLAPLARVAARAAGAEPGADVAAITVTRFPPGLLAALEAVAAAPEVSTSTALVPLWFAPPGGTDELALRLEILRELV
ncbi:MAG: M48 family metalloprotease [Acidimicrobiales bacterium]